MPQHVTFGQKTLLKIKIIEKLETIIITLVKIRMMKMVT